MRPFRLTLKNYRCFEDTSPLVVDIGPGLTAFIGPNNAGKSTLLKFFYEMRDLLIWPGASDVVTSMSAGGVRGTQPHGTVDPAEILYNRNDRSTEIGIEFLDATANELSRVLFRNTRAEPSNWRADFFVGQHRLSELSNTTDGPQYKINGATSILKLDDWRELAALAAGVMYVGPHRSAIAQSTGRYYDLDIGAAFVTTINRWKTGGLRWQYEAFSKMTEEIAILAGYESIEINAADGGDLQIIADKKPYSLREVGAGVAQLIVVLGTVMIRKPTLLLIDEPEIHLHPSLQSAFLLAVAGKAGDTVLYATHSLGLARQSATRIYSFTRVGHGRVARKFEELSDFREFMGEMMFGSYRELGCDTTLLVEGVNDVKSVQSLLRLYGKDTKVVVLPMGGEQFFGAHREHELEELTRLTPHVAILIDSERRVKGGPLSQSRQSFIEKCQNAGFRCCVTERRAFENYLGDSAVKRAFGGDRSALSSYEALKSHSPNWPKSDNWKAAREMTKEDLANTDLGAFLEAL